MNYTLTSEEWTAARSQIFVIFGLRREKDVSQFHSSQPQATPPKSNNQDINKNALEAKKGEKLELQTNGRDNQAFDSDQGLSRV